MKKRKDNFSITQICGLFCAIIFFAVFISAKEKIPGNTFDRQVPFKAVLEIKETDDSFYFKYPNRVYADDDENIYVLDYNRLLKFSITGLFMKNLIRSGQGPGEITSVSNLQIDKNGIVIHNNHPSKIIRLNTNGVLEKELRLEKSDHIEFCFYDPNYYYFFESVHFIGDTDGKYIDEEQKLVRVSAEGKNPETIFTFLLKKYYAQNGGAFGTLDVAARISAVYDNRYLFLYHTPDYKIKRIDVKENAKSIEFGIDYKRREVPKELFDEVHSGLLILNGKKFKKPEQKYLNDIRNLLIYKKNLWVVTSTVDKAKGTRVDVYDSNGKNTDRFFLKLPNHPDPYSVIWSISGDYLYSINPAGDQDPTVVKYKIDLN